MRDDMSLPGNESGRAGTWLTILGAVGGAAVIYFFSTERGRQWLRELPELGRGWAASIREAMALLREITEQVEQSVGAFEQALGRVGETISAREGAPAGTGRNGGERALP